MLLRLTSPMPATEAIADQYVVTQITSICDCGNRGLSLEFLYCTCRRNIV
jgi:hypothetical protein